MKFYLELIPFIGIYFGIICFINLVVLFIIKDATRTPLKAILYPLNLFLLIMAIPLLIWSCCYIAGLTYLDYILRVLIIFSFVPLSRCFIRPCRIHIWIVEKALGKEHEHVAYLKRERKNNKWRKGR